MNSKILFQGDICWLCSSLLGLRSYVSSQNGWGKNISRVSGNWTQYFNGEVYLYPVQSL